MPELSQKPGFFFVRVRNRVSSLNLGEDAKIIAETRFLPSHIDFLVELIPLYIHLDLRQKQ